MSAKTRTSTNMISALADLAEADRFDVKASEVASLARVATSTAQRFGRERAQGLDLIDVNGRWCASYWSGRFKIREREGYREPAPPRPPDWFEWPTGLAKDASRSGFDVGQRRVLTYRFVQQCIRGEIALAPWQRPAVWTEDQQIALLDSMMRGISIGALTMWHRPRSESVEDARPLPGCARPVHGYTSAHLIVDGQQRATTLVLAALGRLDHWRWNGHDWTRGKGFLTPRTAVLSTLDLPQDEHMAWGRLVLNHPEEAQARIAFDQYEKLSHTDIDLMVLGGTADDMIETYRRLATHGSPHSPADLALMEGWLERRESGNRNDDMTVDPAWTTPSTSGS